MILSGIISGIFLYIGIIRWFTCQSCWWCMLGALVGMFITLINAEQENVAVKAKAKKRVR